MASTDGKKVTFKTDDGKEFEVDEIVAMESPTMKQMIEDDRAGSSIPLSQVNSEILAKVIEYCKKHVESASEADEIKAWDDEFVKVDWETLFDLIKAAHYLDIKGLLDLICQTVADMIKGKRPEEVRRIFNIKNEFTPEEEEEVWRENQWAFE